MATSLVLQALLAGVESGLRRVLALDPGALEALGALQGKVIAIQCTSPAFALYLLPAKDGLHLAANHEAPVDCRLIAPAGSLARLATRSDKSAVLHEPGVSLEGDSGPLLALSEIAQQLNLDWEHELSRWTGPLATALLARVARGQHDWAKRTATSLHQDTADYLTEEARTLVGRREAEARFCEIDDITLQLDRLDARIAQLARNRRERPESP
jgi:ubiquinone biosynthesis accessory factor UbiJ